MSTIVKKETQAIQEGGNFTPNQIDLIKSSLCKDLSNDEFKVFLYTCERTGLDPFAKQIYAIKRGGRMTIQTGIDGYRLIAERTGTYAPGPEPTFTYDKEGKLVSATSYVKKLTKDGTWHTVAATAYYDEYVQRYQNKTADLWDKMPRVMLAKCAEALCIRKCCPAELSGIYTKEEMDQADVEIVQQETEVTVEQAQTMINLINECDPTVQPNILNYIKTKTKDGDITTMSPDVYAKILDTILERREEYQAYKDMLALEAEDKE